LPAPFGPEEAVDLARRDVQVDAVDGTDAAFELPDEPVTSMPRASVTTGDPTHDG
jgi:hypothetical protein